MSHLYILDIHSNIYKQGIIFSSVLFANVIHIQLNLTMPRVLLQTNTWTKNTERELNYNLCNFDQYVIPPIRIELLRKMPFISLPSAWTELNEGLRFQSNRIKFKIALFKYLLNEISSYVLGVSSGLCILFCILLLLVRCESLPPLAGSCLGHSW
jgi:hypothetical protein